MKKVKVQVMGDKLIVGERPKLVIDLNGGENYIETGQGRIPYRRSIQVSRDLLQGKRENVMQTAMSHYYSQACDIAEGYEMAKEFRGRANITVKEFR